MRRIAGFEAVELVFAAMVIVFAVVTALILAGCGHAQEAPQRTHPPFGQRPVACVRGHAAADPHAGDVGRVRCRPGRVAWVAVGPRGPLAEFQFDDGGTDTVRVDEIDEP